MWEFTPKQAAACSCTEIHPLLVRASVTLEATNFHPSSSHMLTLPCSFTDFNRNAPKSRPAQTSHSTWWTILAPHGHWSTGYAHLPWHHPAPAQPSSPASSSPSPPLVAPSKGQQAQALTWQGKAAESHNNPLGSHAHLIDSAKTWGGNSHGSHDAPSGPPGFTSLCS